MNNYARGGTGGAGAPPSYNDPFGGGYGSNSYNYNNNNNPAMSGPKIATINVRVSLLNL
jgi:hypothetical protein